MSRGEEREGRRGRGEEGEGRTDQGRARAQLRRGAEDCGAQHFFVLFVARVAEWRENADLRPFAALSLSYSLPVL